MPSGPPALPGDLLTAEVLARIASGDLPGVEVPIHGAPLGGATRGHRDHGHRHQRAGRDLGAPPPGRGPHRPRLGLLLGGPVSLATVARHRPRAAHRAPVGRADGRRHAVVDRAPVHRQCPRTDRVLQAARSTRSASDGRTAACGSSTMASDGSPSPPSATSRWRLLTFDLGLWDRDNHEAVLTSRGRAFIAETLS